MGIILLEEYQLIYSRAPETAINTPYTTTADFKSGKFLAFQPPFPQVGKIKSPEIGSGTGHGPKPRNGRWPPQELPISGWLNTEFFAHMAARAQGGTVTTTVLSAGVAFDHFIPLQVKSQGVIPRLTTLSIFNEGDDFLHASMAVNNVDVRFGGDEPPQYALSLINTGYSFTRLQDLDPAIVPPAIETYHHVHPDAVEATFNDGVPRDLAGDGRLISGQCGINNQITVQPLPKDPFRVAGNRSTGSYAREMRRHKRVYTPTLKAFMDEDLADFVISRDNTDITSLKYKFIGDPIGASNYNHEVEYHYPLSTLTITSDPEQTAAGVGMAFDIDREDAVGGVCILRIRNGMSSLS